jgi:putative ABC transport system substrate-binding protein
MQATSLRRREFIAVLGGAAAWPLAGRAQQPERVRHVGVLMPWPENQPNTQAMVTAFAQALGRLGWVEDKNIRIDYRFAAGDPTLVTTYAEELVGLSPDALLASTAPVAMALAEQTRTLPIVFVLVPDAIGLRLVRSHARPLSNITGYSSSDASIVNKWLRLLKEIDPRVTRVAAIFAPDDHALAVSLNRIVETTATNLGMTVTLARVHDDPGIEEAFAAHAREPGGGLISLPGRFTTSHRDMIAAAAVRSGLPLVGTSEASARAGALVSYWSDPVAVHAQAAAYIDRILKGANPADLSVQQATKYSLIINLKTAKALGLTVPPSMLDLADEVIE